MIRAGVIGAGGVFTHYARAAEEVSGIELVAVFDSDPAKHRTHEALESLLDEPLDAVLVLTPNASHASIVRACLDRGVPTLCEKPLAPSATAAQALFEHAAANSTLLYAGIHAAHRPEVRWFAEHLDAPVARFTQTWLEDWRHAPGWYFDAAQSGGGVLLDVGINHIDWISRHLPPLEVRAARARWLGEVEHDCDVDWVFDGGHGVTRLSWRGEPEERHSVIESRAGTRYELRHAQNVVVHRGRTHGPWRNDEYACVLRDFIRCINDPTACAPSSAVDTLALIDGIYRHIAERRGV